MIKEVEILVLVDDIETISISLQEYKNITVVADYQELQEKLSDFDYTHSRIAVIDVKYLTNDNIHLYKYIKKDLLYKAVSLIAYGENIPVAITQELYEVDFKGVVDTSLEEQKTILNHVIRRSNLYASTCINNFVRGIIEYESVGEDVKPLTYLLDYLIYKYKISNRNALNIRLVLISLIIAFKNKNILKVAATLKIIVKSEAIEKLYRNYSMPTSFEEKIIAILLKINNLKNPSNYFNTINMTNVEDSLIEEVQEVYNNKILNIASFQDMNFFVEQLNIFTLEHYSNNDISIFESFFACVSNLITASLMRVHYLSASIINNDETIEVRLHCKMDMHCIMKEDTNKSHISITFIDDNTISITFIKNIQKKVIVDKQINKVINVSNINAQHYSDDLKISATKFLEEFVVDQELLEELNENENDMNTLLYEEETLSQNLLDNAAMVLKRYAYILDQTIEFIDLSFSLESLSIVLSNVSLEKLDTSKKETIRFYIQGLINDLGKWKKYIFIEPNTPDIHYLDASLLENCSVIESFILSENSADEKIEEDDDDLEFF